MEEVSMLVFRKKGNRDRFAKWNVIVLIGSLVWLSTCFQFAFLSIFLLSVLPFMVLVVFYAWKRLKRKRLVGAIAHACLDMLRFFAYCSGENIWAL